MKAMKWKTHVICMGERWDMHINNFKKQLTSENGQHRLENLDNTKPFMKSNLHNANEHKNQFVIFLLKNSRANDSSSKPFMSAPPGVSSPRALTAAAGFTNVDAWRRATEHQPSASRWSRVETVYTSSLNTSSEKENVFSKSKM